MKIFTIGHSTHTIAEFIAMLRSFSITVLADIRSMPGSRKYPWFNQADLAASLQEAGIRYIHMPGLGGRRKPRPDSVNTAWHSKSFMGYADYMETQEFKQAIEALELVATNERVAYMCAEAVWWRCHRAMVSDCLKAKGWEVIHIMAIDKSTAHPYTAAAKPVQGNLFYTLPELPNAS